MTKPNAAIIREYFAALARSQPVEAKRQGGRNTWANLTPEQREVKMAKMRAGRKIKKREE